MTRSAALHLLPLPELPGKLTTGQVAQRCELLRYLRLRLRALIQSVGPAGKSERTTLKLRQWPNLLDLQGRLASYPRDVGEPGHGGE